jgi:peptidoglycan hydrolase-like protein with peptidoglycan-binding domain
VQQPLYLNATATDGERSRGPAVLALQIFLIGCTRSFLGIDTLTASLAVTGVYDPSTQAVVVVMQKFLGFPPSECDGNCGPATRRQALERLRVDLDAIFAAMPPVPGRYAQADGTMLEIDQWPAPA